MLNLEDLSQFVAFYKSGTLSKVAEEFHISQPTITRTMKRVEEAFGVSLFSRTANRIEFNEVGIKAVAAAKELLSSAERVQSNIQEFERTLHTISVISCAPAPLWSLIPALSKKHNGKTISSKLANHVEQVKDDFLSKKYHTPEIWLLYPINDEMRKHEPIIFDSGDGTTVNLHFVDVDKIEDSLQEFYK